MKILVCVKQVPDTAEIKIDPVTHTLIRSGVPSIVNPYDRCALEAAARIKDRHPETEIVVISMGPEQAKAALQDCLAIAADRAYLVSGRRFGGSDTMATSYILSTAIRKVAEREGPFDAIFCGKQAIDGDTAQVGPQIAEHLGLPQVTYALQAEVEGESLKVVREADEGKMVVRVALPCLVTFSRPPWDPRLAPLKRRLAALRAEIPVIGLEDLPDIDETRIGLKGSPTKVKRSFVPTRKQGTVIVREDCCQASAMRLIELLSEANYI